MTEQNAALRTEQLGVSIKGRAILQDINLRLEKGRIYGLLGPNGAGKTTLLKVLLGIFPPSVGSVWFDDRNLYKQPDPKIIETIGSIIEYPGFYDNLTLSENIELHLRYLHRQQAKEVDDVLRKVGLYEHRHKLFSQTSLGMKQRLGIARAIAHSPRLLLLDEPTNGLDPYGIKEVREMLIQEVLRNGTTIVISSHMLSEINLMADDLIIMNQGKIIFESAFFKNTQEMHLYRLPTANTLQVEAIMDFSSHVLSKGPDVVEFISVLPPIEVRKHVLQLGANAQELEGYKLSLEDLYLKLLAKEYRYESAAAE
ncbi:ATP-binding cassette domain-containing protein [Paenibacillus wulumuqiensis]|uniref:ATP-binding cassette domain-containing protein n=1 Tax=Paenibacillus wulumuqiensis TaxID=1567107 RepID=UPI000619D7B6|nr:ATP-binding cassette domain-containing protein [Paenibacillus wulumuqiensis]